MVRTRKAEAVEIDAIPLNLDAPGGHALPRHIVGAVFRYANKPPDQPCGPACEKELAAGQAECPAMLRVNDSFNACEPGGRGGVNKRTIVVRMDRLAAHAAQSSRQLGDNTRPKARGHAKRRDRPTTRFNLSRQGAARAQR